MTTTTMMTTTTATLERLSSDLIVAGSKKNELSKTFQDLQSHSSLILSLTLQWQELQSHFDAIETSLNSRLEELLSKEQQINSLQHSLEAKRKELECREKQLDERSRNLVNSNAKVKAEPVEYDCNFSSQLGSKVCSIKKGNIGSISNNIDRNNRNGAELRFSVSMDGKGLQMFLNERVDVHEKIGDEVFAAIKMSLDPAKLVLDAMEGFYYRTTVRNGGKEYALDVVRRSCVLLLEQLMRALPKISANVREDAKKIALEWKGKMGLEELEVLGFLLLVGVYRLVSEFGKDEIAKLFGVLEKHRLACQLRCILGIPDKIAVTIEQALPENSQLNNTVSSSNVRCWPELKDFCIKMDSNGLRLYLCEHAKKHDAMHSEVYDALKCASDPVKLVLDAVLGFNSSNSDGSKHFMLGVNRKSCIFLLEQLMRLSPQIDPIMKEEAMKIALDWKGKFIEQHENPKKVVDFLQLVATFGLQSSFDADELLSLLKNVYKQKQAPDLFRILGFANKIHKFVHFLVKKKNVLEAIRYIYAFDMVDKFSPVQLLKDNVEYVMFRTKKLYQEGCITQTEASKKEIDYLKAAIKCISDHKLDSGYSPQILEKRLAELENHNGSTASKAEKQKHSGIKRSRTAISTEAAPNASVTTTTTIHPIQPSRSSTIHSNQPSTSSTIHSMQPPQQAAGMFTPQGVSYSSTLPGYYNTGGSNPLSLDLNSSSGIKRCRMAISTEPAPNASVTTTSIIHTMQPRTASSIQSTQPSTSSTIHSMQPPQQAAGMFTPQGVLYSSTPPGFYNMGGSAPFCLNLNSSSRPHAIPGSTFLGSHTGLSPWLYGSRLAANGTMGQFGMAGAYSVGMYSGIANPDSSLHYYSTSKTQGL